MNGSVPHRVHVHGFACPGWDAFNSEIFSREVNIHVNEWLWQGVKPDVKPMRAARKSRWVKLEQVGGMYYVLANKLGTMFRASTHWPFTDVSLLFQPQESG